MAGKYQISKKGIKILNLLSFKTYEEVYKRIMILDLFPPFKVTDTSINKDVTNYVLEYLETKDYLFVKKEEIYERIPKELLNMLSQNGENLFFTYKQDNVKLSNKFYIKEVTGFFPLWKKDLVAFGYQGANILFINPSESNVPVYKINHEDVNNLGKQVMVSCNCHDFITALVPRKK